MLKTPLSAAAMAAALIASPALAGTPAKDTGAQSMVIKYSDLNLATAEGQERLERRINAAARKVCNIDRQRTGTRIQSAKNKACYAKARKSARNQMASLISETRRGG